MSNMLVDNYLSKAKGLPFFYVVSDDNYRSVLSELQRRGLKVIKTSDFCKNADRFPALDDLIDSFRIADVDCATNKYVLIGLGEYLALRGEAEALKVIRGLKNTTLGNARVVILLRYIRTQVKTISEEDLRLKAQRVYFDDGDMAAISITNIRMKSNLGLVSGNGIKELLKQFETGATGNLFVSTDLDLSKSLFPVAQIDNAYDAIRQIVRSFSLPAELGSNEYWGKLLIDLQKNHNSMSAVLSYDEDSEDDFINKAFGLEYRNWLYFITLKLNIEKIKNPYLKYILQKQKSFETLQVNIVNGIIEIPHRSPQFKELYDGRKKIIKALSSMDGAQYILDFIQKNNINPSESVYKLTDITIYERQAIIAWVSQYGLIPEIDYLYPALSAYCKKYEFTCVRISHILTDYFDQYKKQKISNSVAEEFKASVSELALNYTTLATRENILASIDDKEHTFLYWIDALGVEYLSYIQELAKTKGLALHVDIVRAELPTITSLNRTFFDDWSGAGKKKESRLDEIKHKDEGGFDYSICKTPIHLANELDVVKEAIAKAAVELSQHRYKKFIIASDHGASRLAVIGQYEEKYETDTKGEHSGRCCKYFDGCEIKNSIIENGYVVLTDYGRFKKSRAANVEVHGGATLEETVVPLITLSLKNINAVELQIINPDNIVIERKVGVRFMIYISEVESPLQVKVVYKEKSYQAEAVDSSHFRILIPEIKRSGKYLLDIFEGENLLGQLTINVKGAVGTAKGEFDDLF